jgi:hypothetical protein
LCCGALRCVRSLVLWLLGGWVNIGFGWGHAVLWLTSSARRVVVVGEGLDRIDEGVV